MFTQANLDHWFMHHPPKGDQLAKYDKVREAAKKFAEVVLEVVPQSADQSAAFRHIRDAMMTANSGIACEGR